MKKFIYLLLLIPVAYSFSQNRLDTITLKCGYTYTYLKDTVSNTQNEDLLYLQIGNNLSKCYSYYTFQSDSLSLTKDGKEIRRQLFKKAITDAKGGVPQGEFPYKRMRTYVYKNYPQGKMTVTDGLSLQDYVYEDELNAQQWEIKDSTKTILDYQCQMAVCDFRGRQWSAWFTTDIPISDGPWKFSGLPGLIMEVYDKGDQYVFTIVGIQRVTDEPIVFSETYSDSKRFEKTNRKDFLKAKKRYLMNINGYIEMETGINLSGGEPAKIMRYDLIECDYK